MAQSFQTDNLTGLPNITFFRSLSQKILDSEFERSKGLVFIYFDIKNFRAFNYLYGFDEGDKLLVHVGNVISKVFPELHVSRFSDDRFLLIAYNSDIERRLTLVRNRVASFKRTNDIFVKAGVFIVPDKSGENSVRAYDCAKLACESVKNLPNVHVGYYSEELGRKEKLREHIIESIDDATSKEYIKVYYQPIVHVMNKKICAYEGLARWEDPEFGFLSPADFIGTLEDARLIHKLDVFVLRKICSDMKTCIEHGWTVVPVSMNLSALDFQLVNMPYIAETALQTNQLPHDLLSIEITESALGENRQEIYQVLERFRRSGFEIWLDNFGSKYSSLNVLEEVDVDLLKIDMRFLRNFHAKSRSRSILKNIMNMAKELGIRTLMEGVEDEEVLEFLRQTGCESAQGFLFGRPTPFDMIMRSEKNHEDKNERHYYNAIGRVNLLSQTPLKTGWSAHATEEQIEIVKSANKIAGKFAQIEDLNFMLNGLPLAITEFDGRRFRFLMSNANFRDIFKNLGLGEKCSPDDVFNNFSLQFAIKIHQMAQQCIKTGGEDARDFVTSEGFYNIRLRCIAYNSQTQTGALLAVVDHISGNASLNRERRQDTALRFLYTLYSRIDLLKCDGTSVENIYINSSRYLESFVKDSVKISTKNFAERNIHIEDRIKFERFYDLKTIDERVSEVGGTYVIDYFRTRNARHNFTWQMYMLVPIIHHGEKYLLSCVRSIDAERMRRLPEIDRQGTEYYDMPGNPNFLLLASRSFTSTLNYGSFEKFLHNSFYFEANLTADRVLYMHLGQQGMVSTESNYSSMPYDEVIRDMILNTVEKDFHRETEKFFDRERLLNEYNGGKVFGQTEFLRRPDEESNPRWLHSAYQIRESNETNDIHAFFLVFDIDAYRRTNEAIITLIERDNLTGLYNRGTAVNLIQKFLSVANWAAFIILDLDNFKQINDRYGHDCGDMIIKDAAARMKESFEDDGVVARIGGDEFVVVLKNVPPADVETRLKDFSESFKSVDYKGQRIIFTMSIGYALFPEQGKTYKELYQNADMALYTVKMAGRNSFKKFSPKMVAGNRTQLGVSLSQLSEGMPGGFLLYRNNEEQEILYANTRLWKIYECESLDEFRKLTGNSFRGCVHEEDAEVVEQIINEQIELSDGYDYVRYRIKTAKGNIKVVEDFGRLVQSEDDEIFYVFMIDFENKEKLWENIGIQNE